MKQIRAFIIALIFSIHTVVFVINTYVPKINAYYKVTDNSVRYSDSTDKDLNRDILMSNIDRNTVILMGSSELIVNKDKKYQPKYLFNHEDLKIMQIGGYDSQNIVHATILGSIGNAITSKKLVLIESVQWFDKEGMKGYNAVTKISKEHVYNALLNAALSLETKKKLIDRVIQLSSNNLELQQKYREYKEDLLGDHPDKIRNQLNILDIYVSNLRKKNNFYFTGIKETMPLLPGSTPLIDWDALIQEESKKQELKSDNNIFGIDNYYYNKYLKPKMDSLKGSQKELTYSDFNSPEYQDMELFLQIAKELGIEVEVIIQPVNGLWYDYIGFDKSKRIEAYTNIQRIAEKFNAKVVNYENYEYEPEFMFDTMHFGAKGWIEVSKEIYNFFKGK